MSRDAYQNAVTRREEIQKELAEIDQFLALHRKFSFPNLVAQGDMLDVEPPPKSQSAGFVGRKRSKITPNQWIKLIKVVLKEHGSRMTRGGIAEALEKKGHKIPSTAKPKYIGTIIWRSQEFEADDYGYWPKDTLSPLLGSGQPNDK